MFQHMNMLSIQYPLLFSFTEVLVFRLYFRIVRSFFLSLLFIYFSNVSPGVLPTILSLFVCGTHILRYKAGQLVLIDGSMILCCSKYIRLSDTGFTNTEKKRSARLLVFPHINDFDSIAITSISRLILLSIWSL